MGKASRSKQRLTTREKIAMQRAAERRAQVRTRVSLAIGSVVVVVGIVVAFVVVKATSNGSASKTTEPTGVALAKVIHDVTNVPESTLAAVGGGPTSGTGRVTPPTPMGNQPALTKNGLPEIVYIGAEYCPFCATERWSMAVALSRFGTFKNLGVTHSDPNDVYANTSTLTFYKSNYSSKYVVFSPVEETDPNRKPLQNPTSEQTALLNQYDKPPYVQGQAGAIPFIDIGNKFLVSGASFSPQLLQGKTWNQISADLSKPSSAIGQSVGGAANYITAAICTLTKNQPANVCTAPSIKALSGRL
ncbi:MAG: DUF929 family protein [Micromonosporaceae bacterium]